MRGRDLCILRITPPTQQAGDDKAPRIRARTARTATIIEVLPIKPRPWVAQCIMDHRFAVFLLTALIAHSVSAPPLAVGGQLKLSVVDKDTSMPLPARMHLKNAAGRMPKVPKVPVWADHFVFDGEITLTLPKGHYQFELECGPEFLDQQGHFEINDFADDEKTLEMRRFVDMAKEEWYSGDLDLRRPVRDLELLMRADDLHVAHVFSGPRVGPKRQAIPPGITRFGESRCFRDAEGAPPWRDVLRPTDWRLPLCIAHHEVDSIELASSQLHRSGVAKDEKDCKPRDPTLFPGPEGIARWGERVYFHLLNCGLRIPPSAGSGSGAAPNPVGYNRVYVHVNGDFSYDAWLEGLRAGRVVITNGPMIRPTVEGEYPGHVFRADEGQQVELEVSVNLATREKIEYFEIVQNGAVAHSVRLDAFKQSGGRLPKVVFKTSGWFVLRVVTNNQKTHRFAMTAPYYVEIGYQPHISRESAQFFLNWTEERMRMLKPEDAEQDRWQATHGFWEKLVAGVPPQEGP